MWSPRLSGLLQRRAVRLARPARRETVSARAFASMGRANMIHRWQQPRQCGMCESSQRGHARPYLPTRRLSSAFRRSSLARPSAVKSALPLTAVSHRKFALDPERQYRILVLGAPGVGKGTYSKFIQREFDAGVMTSGDLLRELAKQETSDGRYVKACIEEGRLVEDDIVIPMVISYLRSFPQSFILDGFPRTLNQAERINHEYGLDIALHFRLPKHILITKLLGRRVCESCGSNFNLADIDCPDTGIVMPSLSPKVEGVCDNCGGTLVSRADDKLEVIKDRLRLFEKTHEPILEFYKSGGCLVTHDIKRGIDDAPEIIEKMNTFLGRK